MSSEILAPMPGTIVQVLVSAGDEVVEGQEMVVLEAMKMENPIVATAAGKVKEVNVAVDDKVATNQALLSFE